MNVSTLGKTVKSYDPSERANFQFAIDPPKLSGELRRMADAIDAGEVLPQQVRLIQRLTVDDFVEQSLIVRFCEKVPHAAEKHSPGSSDPEQGSGSQG